MAAIGRLRVPLLAIFGLVVAHDAIFASDAGVAALAGALARSGHGDGWALITVSGLAGAVVVALGVLARILRLRTEIGSLDGLGTRAPSAGAPRTASFDAYRAEIRRIWPWLFAAVAIGFLVQENVEALLGGSHAAGLEPLISAHPFAVPILLLLTLGMALIGALVRRHTQALEQRLAQLRARLPRGTQPVATRTALGALPARDSIRLRPEAGRAPPLHAALVSA